MTRYHQRRACGECRVDDKLYLELTQYCVDCHELQEGMTGP
ncbi:MAG: hypothetical protein ACXVG9_09825 [Terriglobales bacterium]